uniref:Uncharacterized protein n=1 Tax=Picea glauca TaxID=3330 RepID=A0A101M5H5_PICGL|nr:hypothetical protein ABT39_MTgene1104 [Picea glauca]
MSCLLLIFPLVKTIHIAKHFSLLCPCDGIPLYKLIRVLLERCFPLNRP